MHVQFCSLELVLYIVVHEYCVQIFHEYRYFMHRCSGCVNCISFVDTNAVRLHLSTASGPLYMSPGLALPAKLRH